MNLSTYKHIYSFDRREIIFGEGGLFVTNAVFFLWEICKKFRISEVKEEQENIEIYEKKPEIPPYAIDRHTQWGRDRGLGFRFYVWEGGTIVQPNGKIIP